ncbi:MAG: F0F1 ATP synthase subunit A [Alphaproteobacteria bacterium]|nr:F0F1 ATP synthase subunit A [Alphaproteobacteria bacterium]
MDPLQQFKIKPLVPVHIGGYDFSFTNASLFMVLTTFAICLFIHFSTKKKRLIPNRLQVCVESLFHFIADMVTTYVGKEGLKFFPYILSLFLFILFGNLIGLVPYAFTFTSHIIVTFALASFVFLGITIVGFVKHGTHFFRIFYPSGIPIFVAPLLIPVEIISYLSRPISLSVRLFANMVAGHVMLKIFACFAVLLAGTSLVPAAILPTLLNVAITSFELLVAILQAYVFTILTCIYLNDALNLH